MSTFSIQVDFGQPTLDAVNRLADALTASTKVDAPSGGGGAKRGRRPQDEPAEPAKSTEPESTGADAAAVRKVLRDYADEFGRDGAVELLAGYDNATNITTLDPKHYEAVLKAMQEKLAEKAGE